MSIVVDEGAERIRTKCVGEIMIPLDAYPHIPDRFTLAQAMMEIELAQIDTQDRKSIPRFLIVFNDKNQLVGICRRRDLLRGLEPRFVRGEHVTTSEPPYEVEFDPNLLDFTSGHLVDDMRRRAQKPVSDVMIRNVMTIDYNDHIMKAAHMIVHHDITCLPVIKDNQVVGVVRTVELFREIADAIIEW